MRGCELAALRIQDRVLAEGSVADPDYVARRDAAVVIAVECSVASATCFCTSMGTGPEVRRDDADLVLTELDDGFVVRAGSETGRSLAERLPLEAAGVERTERGRASVARVRRAIGDPVAVEGLRDRLLGAARVTALGRGRGPLPRLRELHPRLPDLLLHERQPAYPTSTATPRLPFEAGIPASRATSPRSPAATSGRDARTATGSG